jgi:signal peptidase I
MPALGPQRWDVVVFKVPTDGETNYIKRLLGLPGDRIELIDGDLFVNDRIQPKTADAQRSLWFRYYDHDHPPREVSRRAGYAPRWEALRDDGGWTGLETRVLHFASHTGQSDPIQFATNPLATGLPGHIEDVYAYNFTDTHQRPAYPVSDVRLSAEVAVTQMGADGYLELSLQRNGQSFYARLGGDGQLVLQHQHADGPRETWGTHPTDLHADPRHLAFCHVDGTVVVELGGQPVLRAPADYTITPAEARDNSHARRSPVLQFVAADAELTLRHVLIERDVFYTSNMDYGQYGVQGHPLVLGDNEYFLIGDNSPNSQDARFAFARPWEDPRGPHLRQRDDFHAGTVPGDQLIGRAFFVYWPGFQPLTPRGPNILPDVGRARWIR